MCVAAHEELVRLNDMGLLNMLLADKSRGGKIVGSNGVEITVKKLIGGDFRLKSRAEKSKEAQLSRTKSHAEVFTPAWIVKKMNDYIDADWFGYDHVFDDDTIRVAFPGRTWREYVDSRRLEITCGEAPYITSAYDVSTGEHIDFSKRVGILDRKLRVVNENAESESEWVKYAFRALESTYGYEYQGDNLILARLNVFLSFEEAFVLKLHRRPDADEYKRAVRIISWNIWQMDGLTGLVPVRRRDSDKSACKIFDWRSNQSVFYNSLRRGI